MCVYVFVCVCAGGGGGGVRETVAVITTAYTTLTHTTHPLCTRVGAARERVLKRQSERQKEREM